MLKVAVQKRQRQRSATSAPGRLGALAGYESESQLWHQCSWRWSLECAGTCWNAVQYVSRLTPAQAILYSMIERHRPGCLSLSDGEVRIRSTVHHHVVKRGQTATLSYHHQLSLTARAKLSSFFFPLTVPQEARYLSARIFGDWVQTQR
jgi:hypothetical protein